MVKSPIPLDEHGLPVDDLDLPEGLLRDLEAVWAQFLLSEAAAALQEAEPPAAPRLPPLPPKESTGMAFFEFLGEARDEGPGWLAALLGWSLAASVAWGGLIAHMVDTFSWSYLGDGDTHPGLLLLATVLNPVWLSLLLDAILKNARWWTTIPLLAVAVTLVVSGISLDAEIFGFDSWEHWLFWADVGLIVAATKLPWFFLKDGNSRRAEVLAERARLTDAWQVRVERHHTRQQERRLARQEAQARDPALLLRFIREESSHIWGRHEEAWRSRLSRISDSIGRGEVELRVARDMEDDPVLLAAKEEAIRGVIAELRREREEITRAQDQLAASKKALEHLATRIQASFDKMEADRKLEEWLKSEKRSLEAARIALERSKLELEITVRWFHRQLGTQLAAIQAAGELPDGSLAERTRARPTEEQEQAKARLEVARAVVEKSKK